MGVIIDPKGVRIQDSVSLSSQPQMNGGKERKENLNASHFCLAGNMGLPVAGLPTKGGDLYGNGAAIVPNVYAVMAWAARQTGRLRGTSSEEL